MSATVVRYALDGQTAVGFEIEPAPGFRPVGNDELIGELRQALAPAVAGARAVVDKVREAGPDEVQVRFGIKVSGTMNWWVAKAATEGNFEVTLTWRPGEPGREPVGAGQS
jgi:hypothetical protein